MVGQKPEIEAIEKKLTRFQGAFYSSKFANESAYALASDEENKILISGDTNGYVYLWDIANYMIDPPQAITHVQKYGSWKWAAKDEVTF